VGVERRIVLRDSTPILSFPLQGEGMEKDMLFQIYCVRSQKLFFDPRTLPSPGGRGREKKRLSRRELGAKGGIYDRGQYISG
jgi:hypothetical protein